MKSSSANPASAVFSVTGTSMVPFVLPRSRVYVEPAEGKRPTLGDIVCFPSGNSKVVGHRIVGFSRDGEAHPLLVVRGDSQAWPEEIEMESIVYRVVRVEWRGLSYECDSALGGVMKQLTLRAPSLVRLVARLMIGTAAMRRKILGPIRGSSREPEDGIERTSRP